jgi:glycosyltransferase involved in cell wall biosynthesis
VSRPFVSVIMAALNHERFVADAVASVLDQDYDALELIAIDDCSDDPTADVLEECAAAAPRGRMRVVRHDRRQGIAATRAHALSLARGEFVGLLDSDDLWLQGKLGPQVDLLLAEPGVGLTHATFEAFASDTGERVAWDVDPWDTEGDQLVELVRRGCFVMTGTTLIRRAAIDRRGVGFTSSGYASYDDYLLFLTLALDYRLAYEPRTVMRYRRHAGNLTNTLLVGNVAQARLQLLSDFVARFPEARGRLGGEWRRTLARLYVSAAAHEGIRDPQRAARSLLGGIRQDPAEALDEVARHTRARLARRSA